MKAWAGRGVVIVAWVSSAAALTVHCVGDDSTVVPDAGSDGTTAADVGAPETGTDAVVDVVTNDASDAGVDVYVDAGPAHMFVANYNNGSGGSIKVFDMPVTDASAPTLTLNGSNGLGAPRALRVDATGTHLWVADGSNSKVFAFSLPLSGSSAATATLTPTNIPNDLQFDSNGNLWVVEFSGLCERWNSPPSGTPSLHVSVGTANVFGIDLDSADNLYVGNTGSPSLAYFSAPQVNGASPTFTNSNFASSISGVAVTSSEVYVGSYASGTLVSFARPLSGTTTSTAVTSGHDVWQLSFSPTGDLVVPGLVSDTVVFLKAPGFTTPINSVSSGLADPRSVAFGQ